jgi:hypothetical protein
MQNAPSVAKAAGDLIRFSPAMRTASDLAQGKNKVNKSLLRGRRDQFLWLTPGIFD